MLNLFRERLPLIHFSPLLRRPCRQVGYSELWTHHKSEIDPTNPENCHDIVVPIGRLSRLDRQEGDLPKYEPGIMTIVIRVSELSLRMLVVSRKRLKRETVRWVVMWDKDISLGQQGHHQRVEQLVRRWLCEVAYVKWRHDTIVPE